MRNLIPARITPLEVIFLKHILGCHTTSKVSTKKAAFQNSLLHGWDLLNQFEKQLLTEMPYLAEKFLVHCWGKSETIAIFDGLRHVNIAIDD